MGKTIVIVIVLLASMSVPVRAQERQPPQRRLDPAEGKEITSEEKIRALIAQLGDDEIKVREAAEESLIDIGEPARAALQAAAKSDDAEVKRRAEYALRVIDLKGKVTFSEKLLKWYPGIYRDLVDSGPAERYAIFRRITEWNKDEERPRHEVEDRDVVQMIALLCAEKYQGIDRLGKLRIINLCSQNQWFEINGPDEVVLARLTKWRNALPEALRHIVDLLGDEDRRVQHDAWHAVGTLKATLPAGMRKECVGQIIPFLKKEDEEVRGMAAIALVELEEKERVPRDLVKDMNAVRYRDPPRVDAALKEMGR